MPISPTMAPMRGDRPPRRRATAMMGAALALLVLSAATPVYAEFVTSKKLADWLDEAARPSGDFEYRTMALGFVAGVHDLLRDSSVCTPDHIRGRKLLLSVRSWMKRNPDKWDEVAAITVRKALTETYPCPPDDKQ